MQTTARIRGRMLKSVQLMGIAMLLSLLAVTAQIAIAPQVFAATMAAGYHGKPIAGKELPHLGAWLTRTGIIGYCIEPGLHNPVSSQQGATVQSSLPGYNTSSLGHNLRIAKASGLTLARINYVLAKWGDTNDRQQAASVQFAVWLLRSTPEAYLQTFHDVTGFRASPGYWVLRNQAQMYLNEAYASVTEIAAGEPKLLVNFSDSLSGTVTLANSSGYSGTVQISGAKFTDGTTSKQIVSGESIDFVANVSNLPNLRARVEAAATVIGNFASITVHHSRVKNQQLLASKAIANPVKLQASADATFSSFSPIANTRVGSKYVTTAGLFQDIISFDVANKFDATTNPSGDIWVQNPSGEYLPIVAKAVLYRMPNSQHKPPISGEIPAQAEAVFSTKISTSLADGPTKQYSVTAPAQAMAPGYYSWVVSIDYKDQSEATKAALPQNYFWQHDYGLPAETSIIPFETLLNTQLIAEDVGVGGELTDLVTIKVKEGDWFLDSVGKPITVKLTGTVYFTETKPVQAKTAPDNAEVIAKLDMQVNGEGSNTSSVFQVPAKPGFVTVQWCAAHSERLINPGCDDWAIASETAEIVLPKVQTKAVKSSVVSDPVYDTAILEGKIAKDSSLQFRAYRQPDSVTDPVCVAENLVFESKAQTVPAGSYETATEFVSEKTVFTKPGKYYWVETLTTAGGVVLHQGECGLENESTVVTSPTVSSLAQEYANPGSAISDTVIISGVLPDGGLDLKVTAYLQPETADSPVCTADTEVFSHSWRVEQAGEHVSAAYDMPVEPSTVRTAQKIYWIEEASVATSGQLLHRGSCGAVSETTEIGLPKIATLAVRQAGSSQPVFDTAIIEGEFTEPVLLEFRAYLQPNDTELPICSAKTLVHESEPRLLEAGVYSAANQIRSEEVFLSKPGQYFWVETLSTVQGELLHQGECGLTNESTVILPELPKTGGNSELGLGLLLLVALLTGGAAGALGLVSYRTRQLVRRLHQ